MTRGTQIWEDRTRFNLTYLLRASFSVNVDRTAVPTVSDVASNTASIKYLILTAIEKLTESTYNIQKFFCIRDAFGRGVRTRDFHLSDSTSAHDRVSTSRIDEEENA